MRSLFAKAMPGLVWQPTDVDAARRSSVDAHAAVAGLDNLRPAIALDATAPGWGAAHAGQDLIVLVNLLHLISEAEARTLIAEVAQALAPGGIFVLYGPFLRDGETTSEGDSDFPREPARARSRNRLQGRLGRDRVDSGQLA